MKIQSDKIFFKKERITAVTTIPTERDLFVLGSENGTLSIWDFNKYIMLGDLSSTIHDKIYQIKTFYYNKTEYIFALYENGIIKNWTNRTEKTQIFLKPTLIPKCMYVT